MSKLLYDERRLIVKFEDYFTFQEESIMSLEQRLANSSIKPGLNVFTNMTAIGLEAANGFVKAISDCGDGKFDTYLNTITPSTEKEYQDSLKGITREPVYKINGNYYKVGLKIDKKTFGNKQEAFTSRNEKKYQSETWQAAFLIACYRQLLNKIDGKGNAILETVVTTGLPVNDDKRTSLKDYLREVFVGTHEINDQKFTIKQLNFLGQGTASFFDAMYIVDDEGNVERNKKYFAETAPQEKGEVSKVLWLDFGWGTLDRKLVIDNTPQPSETEDEDNGMRSVWTEVLEAVRSKKENEWLLGVDILRVEDQIREGKEITLNFKTADISEEFDEAMRAYSERVIKGIYTGGSLDNMVFDAVYCIGGGAISLKPYLEEAVANYHEEEGRRDAYKYPKNPQHTNCSGYLKYSQIQKKKMIDEKSK